MKTSEAQLKANKTWREKNKEKDRRDGYIRNARSIIRNHATLEDLEDFKIIIAERERQLKEQV